MSIVKKVIFWILGIMVAMFIGCWALATASYIHVGHDFGVSVVDGFCDVADSIGTMIGARGTKVKPDYEFDFKNGNITFANTHIGW